MLNSELRDLHKTVLNADVKDSRVALGVIQNRIGSLEAIQNVRENALVIKNLYAQYPDLDALTLGVYYCGQDELDFFLRDVVTGGEDDSDLEEELVDVMSNFFGDSPVTGVLNSDGDMLKFYEALTKIDTQTEARILETTRGRVERALQSDDPNALSAELFPAQWETHTSSLLESQVEQTDSNRKLTVFADTTDAGPLVRFDIDEVWLARAEGLAEFARENDVSLSMPIELVLAHDGTDDFGHEAEIYPRADGVDAVAFNFYLARDPQNTISTPVIGLGELRQAIELGMSVYCIDFGLEELDAETAMAEFGLSLASDGSLVEASAGGPRPKM